MLVELSITHPEKFYISDETGFPSTMVKLGGGSNKMTVGSMKSKFNKLISTTSAKNSTFESIIINFFKKLMIINVCYYH